MSHKGISTVIASILMLMITIALAGTAYLYISGTFTGKTSTAFELVESVNDTVTIRNSGTGEIKTIRATLDGNAVDVAYRYWIYPDYSGWSDTRISVCAGKGMMGGYNNFGTGVATQMNLPNLPSGDYEVSFFFYFIDSWDGESGRLFWNGNQIWTSGPHSHWGEPTNYCGGWVDYLPSTAYSSRVSHSGGDATIRFDSTLDQTPDDESWALTEF